MNAEDYLIGISNLDTMLQRRQDEFERIESVVYSITADLSPRESCSLPLAEEKQSKNIVKYMTAKERLEEALTEYIDRRNECIELIEKMDNQIFADILYKKYLENKTWGEIAKEMCYSYHHVIRLHGSALIKFQEVLDER